MSNHSRMIVDIAEPPTTMLQAPELAGGVFLGRSQLRGIAGCHAQARAQWLPRHARGTPTGVPPVSAKSTQSQRKVNAKLRACGAGGSPSRLLNASPLRPPRAKPHAYAAALQHSCADPILRPLQGQSAVGQTPPKMRMPLFGRTYMQTPLPSGAREGAYNC